MTPPSPHPRPRPSRPTPANLPEVHLHIDRLVLDGLPFDQPQARRLESSLLAELTRQLHQQPALADSLAAPRKPHPVPSVHLPPDASPEAAGRTLARAIFHTLSTSQTVNPSHRAPR